MNQLVHVTCNHYIVMISIMLIIMKSMEKSKMYIQMIQYIYAYTNSLKATVMNVNVSVHYPSTIFNHYHCYFNLDRQDGETISVNSNHAYIRLIYDVNMNTLQKEFQFVNVSTHRTLDVHKNNISYLLQTDALLPPCENAEELSLKEKMLIASILCNGTSIFPQYIECIQTKTSELCHSCKCFLYKRNITKANKNFSDYGVSEGDALCRKCYN